MSQRKKPAVDKALSFLRDLVEKIRMSSTDFRLPTTLDLARQAGVSPACMTQALRELSTSGDLTVRTRGGIHVNVPDHRAPATTTDRWESVRARIERDMLEGRLRAARRLPGRKELASLYGCGFHVLRRALNALVSQGMLRQDRRTLVSRFGGSVHSGNCVTLLVGEDFQRQIYSSAFRNRVEVFTSTLEHECGRRNLVLQRDEVSAAAMMDIRDNCLGYLVYVTASLHAAWNNTLRQLPPGRKPASFFHVSPQDGHPAFPPDSRSDFELDEEQAGFDMGQELLILGHRNVCFVGYEHSDYADRRLSGLRRSFSAAGYADGMHDLRFSTDVDYIDAHRQGLSTYGRNEVQRIERQYAVLNPVLDTIEQGTLDSERRVALTEAISQQLFLTSVQRGIVPVMERLQTIQGLSAVVTADDNIALNGVLPFVHSTGMKVPAEFSVVSFNGTFEASQAGLTSYQFDMAALAVGMLDRILSPRRGRPGRSGSRCSLVGGILVRRPSLGIAPREVGAT